MKITLTGEESLIKGTLQFMAPEVMLDQAAGMESRRIQERIIRVRDAVTSVSDGRAAAELAERVADMTGVPLQRR